MNESDDYLWDRRGPADPDVARLEQLLSPLAHDAPLDELRLRKARRRRIGPWLVGGIAVAAAIALVAWWRWPAPGVPPVYACGVAASGFAFQGLGGPVACGGADTASGVLPVGEVLDTRTREAELVIADIGRARLGAGTRVRLERTSAERHQLFLERGTMHAKVNAPPRIFAVATPGASVVDLGCEYTLEIDERGAGAIDVLTGKVEIEGADRQLVVLPAGTRARLLPGRRAGLPLVNDAPAALVEAARAFDDRAPGAVERVLAAARAEDAFTVVNLAMIVRDGKRGVLARLAELSPPPTGVSIESAVADPQQLARWHGEILLLLDTRLFFDMK